MLNINFNYDKFFLFFFTFLNFTFLTFTFILKKKIHLILKKNRTYAHLNNINFFTLTHSIKYKPEETSIIFKEFYPKFSKNIDINDFYLAPNNIKKYFFFKLLSLITLHSFHSTKILFPRTFFFNFFYFYNTQKNELIINVNKLLQRWLDSFNLISNLFYYNLTPLCYSSPLLKNETLSLNWYYSTFEFSIWKYSYSFFIFKTNRFDRIIDLFYKKLKKCDEIFFLVIDSLYHFKNLYYFKKNFLYTIGLIPLNINPWLVHYPVFTSFYSYLNQILFFKFVLFASKQILRIKYLTLKKIWTKTFNL